MKRMKFGDLRLHHNWRCPFFAKLLLLALVFCQRGQFDFRLPCIRPMHRLAVVSNGFLGEAFRVLFKLPFAMKFSAVHMSPYSR